MSVMVTVGPREYLKLSEKPVNSSRKLCAWKNTSAPGILLNTAKLQASGNISGNSLIALTWFQWTHHVTTNKDYVIWSGDPTATGAWYQKLISHWSLIEKRLSRDVRRLSLDLYESWSINQMPLICMSSCCMGEFCKSKLHQSLSRWTVLCRKQKICTCLNTQMNKKKTWVKWKIPSTQMPTVSELLMCKNVVLCHCIFKRARHELAQCKRA